MTCIYQQCQLQPQLAKRLGRNMILHYGWVICDVPRSAMHGSSNTVTDFCGHNARAPKLIIRNRQLSAVSTHHTRWLGYTLWASATHIVQLITTHFNAVICPWHPAQAQNLSQHYGHKLLTRHWSNTNADTKISERPKTIVEGWSEVGLQRLRCTCYEACMVVIMHRYPYCC